MHHEKRHRHSKPMPSASIVFVDTNVLRYAEDGADKLRHRALRGWLCELWLRRCELLSSQVLSVRAVNPFLVGPELLDAPA